MNSNTKNAKILLGILGSLISSVLWGMSFLFTKKIVSTYSIMSLLGWRFLIAFLMMWLLVGLKVLAVDFKKPGLKKLFGLIVIYPVAYFVGESFGVKWTTSSEAGVIISTAPLVVIVLNYLITKEKPSRFQVLGILLSFIGIALSITASGLSASLDLRGYLMLAMALLSYAIYAVFLKHFAHFSAVEKTFVTMMLGALFFFGAGLIEETMKGNITAYLTLPFRQPDFLLPILYLSLGSSIIGFFAANISLENLGANRSVSFAGLTTLISILGGVIVLKEDFGPLKILVSILIISGVYIANARQKGRA